MARVTVVIFISFLQISILYSSNLDPAPVWCILFGVYWMLVKFFKTQFHYSGTGST